MSGELRPHLVPVSLSITSPQVYTRSYTQGIAFESYFENSVYVCSIRLIRKVFARLGLERKETNSDFGSRRRRSDAA